jgi:hypothetical protein
VARAIDIALQQLMGRSMGHDPLRNPWSSARLDIAPRRV